MTMDVSRLGIVVESDGINEARKALDGGNGKGGLVGAADKAERSVSKLTDTVNKLMTINAGGFASAWNQSMMQLVSTLGAMNLSVKDAIANLNAMAPALDRAAQATQRAANANERKAYSGGVVVNTLKAMTTAAVAYEAVNFGLSIIKQADAWQMMTARLQNATGSLHNAGVAQQQMFDLSQRLRVPLEDSVKLYTRLAPAVQRMGKDSNYAKDMVEGIATALQLGGANGAEASSVMLQLSQSFSSGVLNGAEFNAVAENGSVLMRALERATGKSTSELKKMGSEGKLSMAVVGKAIQDNLPLWREQFDKLPLTFEGATQRLKNAWTKAVGQMGQDTGFNQELSKSLRVIEDMIPAVAQGLGNAFIAVMGWVSENKQFLGEIWDQVVGLGKDIWNVGKSIGAWIGQILGAGDSFSVVAAAIYTVRLLVAGLQDGFTMVKGVIAFIGALIYKVLVDPIVFLVTRPLALLLEGIAKVYALIAAGAKAAGMDSLADQYAQATKTLSGFSTDLVDIQKKSVMVGDALASTADDFVASIREGRGEVAKLLNEGPAGVVPGKTNKDGMDPNAWNANKNPKPPVDKNAQKAAENELKRYNDAMAELNAKLREQQKLQEALATSGLNYDKIGPAQKKVIELEEKLKEMQATKATAAAIAHQQSLIAKAQEIANLELENEKTQTFLKTQQSFLDQERTAVKSAKDAALEAEKKLATYGMEKGAIEALTLAEAERAVEAFNMLHAGEALTEQEKTMLSLMQEKVDWLKRLKTANAATGAKEAATAFDKLFDDRKAEKFGNAIAEGFGKAGKALGALSDAMTKYQARQAKIAQGQKELDKTSKGTAEYTARSSKLAQEETEAHIASYADLAGAAKGFFSEGSRGYKAMETAEKTFRLFQMAMQLEAFARESGLLAAITGLFVTSKATETAAEVASVGPHVAAEGTKQGANAITALTSALAAPFPINLAAYAVVAAMLASIGAAVGGAGGGGFDISKQRQDSQGTGTVFGDSTAKSESISKSIELLSKNSDIALRYSSGMLTSLQNIEYSMTGATSGVIRSGDVTGKDFVGSSSGMSQLQSAVLFGVGGPIVKLLDNALGGIVSKVLGFGSKTTLQDSGLSGSSQSVQDILSNGFKVQGYQDVNTKKKAFGITYSNKNSTNYSAVDPSISNEFGNVIEGMVDSLTAAAEVLGYSGEEVKKKLEAANIDIGKISLKGLSGDEIQKQLEAVFSAIGDNLTQIALPSVTKFQKAGEGLLETAVRVASGVESASYELEKLGLTAIDVGSIINTNGDVATEIVRQTIMLKEAGTGIGDIINTMSGEAGDIADTYKSLLGVRGSLQALGIADDVTRDLIRAAGGLDALQSALESYTSNFFTDDEQNAMKVSALRKEFDKLGVAMPASKADFRSLVESLSATGAEGQALATKVLLLSDSFSSVADAFEQKVTDARSALSDAYDRESSSLTDVKSKFEDFAKTLTDFHDSLLTGDLSTLDVASKYAVEKAKFEETLAKAQAGDETAISSFTDVAQAFLQASRDMNASGEQYTADFQSVLDATDALGASANEKASVAQQQLDALNKQVDGLITVNTSVLTVTQAIDALNAILAGGFVATTGADGKSNIMPVVDGSHRDGLDYVPYDGYIAELHKGEAVLTAAENKAYQMDYSQYGTGSSVALVEEIKALRDEVRNLRDGQREQTGQLIAANYDAQERNAQTVVEGTKEASSTSAYAERAKVTLA